MDQSGFVLTSFVSTQLFIGSTSTGGRRKAFSTDYGPVVDWSLIPQLTTSMASAMQADWYR